MYIHIQIHIHNLHLFYIRFLLFSPNIHSINSNIYSLIYSYTFCIFIFIQFLIIIPNLILYPHFSIYSIYLYLSSLMNMLFSLIIHYFHIINNINNIFYNILIHPLFFILYSEFIIYSYLFYILFTNYKYINIFIIYFLLFYNHQNMYSLLYLICNPKTINFFLCRKI